MKVGILGTGDVGRALEAGFASRKHEVKTGTRSREGSLEETASFADVIVIAVKWSGVENVIDLAKRENFAGKVVIDVTNPLVFGDGPPTLALGHTDSGGEQVQRWLPDAHVVKAFNILNFANMVDPDYPDGPPDMFICGNDDGAKQQVSGILESFGWSAITDLGGIQGARLLEPLCILWVTYGMTHHRWDHAFRVIRK